MNWSKLFWLCHILTFLRFNWSHSILHVPSNTVSWMANMDKMYPRVQHLHAWLTPPTHTCTRTTTPPPQHIYAVKSPVPLWVHDSRWVSSSATYWGHVARSVLRLIKIARHLLDKVVVAAEWLTITQDSRSSFDRKYSQNMTLELLQNVAGRLLALSVSIYSTLYSDTLLFSDRWEFLPKIGRGKNDDESFLQLFSNSSRRQNELKVISEKLLLHFLNLH